MNFVALEVPVAAGCWHYPKRNTVGCRRQQRCTAPAPGRRQRRASRLSGGSGARSASALYLGLAAVAAQRWRHKQPPACLAHGRRAWAGNDQSQNGMKAAAGRRRRARPRARGPPGVCLAQVLHKYRTVKVITQIRRKTFELHCAEKSVDLNSIDHHAADAYAGCEAALLQQHRARAARASRWSNDAICCCIRTSAPALLRLAAGPR